MGSELVRPGRPENFNDEGRRKGAASAGEINKRKWALRETVFEKIEEIGRTDPFRAFCLLTWRDICLSTKAKDSDKNAAAELILDRVEGKSVQRVASKSEGRVEIVLTDWSERGNGNGSGS